jgi:hypothetical protein
MDDTSSQAASRLEQSLLSVATESWRFAKLFVRVLGRLDPGEEARYASQFRHFQRRVEESLAENELRLVNVEGQAFESGMAAEALNIADFGPDDVLVVDQMLEPIIVGPDGLKKQGKVMLRKAIT